MTGGRVLQVFPDGERVEEAALAQAAIDGFVDGTHLITFGQLVDWCGEPERLARRPASPLTSRIVLWSAARTLGAQTFGSYVQDPAFARSALDLVMDLKSGGVSPTDFRSAAQELPAPRRER